MYGGSLGPPILPGSCPVTATVNGSTHAGSTAGTLVVSTARVSVAPATISLSSTASVQVTVHGSGLLDAAALDPAALRVRVMGGTAASAPVEQVAGVWAAALRDVDGDGRPDRVFTVTRAARVGAGLSTGRTQLRVEHLPAAGATRFVASSTATPTVVP